MVEVSQHTAEQLEKLAEKNDGDLEELKEDFREKYEEVRERSDEGTVSDDMVENLALRKTKTSFLKRTRVPSEDIEIAVVGGSVRDTSNGDMFFGSGIVDEEPEQDGGMLKMAAVRIFDDDIAHEIEEAFDQVGNIVTGNFNVSESDKNNQLEVTDTDDTEFEVIRPDDRTGIIEDIRDVVPETSIADIADDLTMTTRNDDGEVYTVSSDIRRITVDIYDGYKNLDTGQGTYTVRDDTVFDEEDVVESDVFDEDEANENAVPGLTCWIDPEKMEYGSESVVEFYGTLSQNEYGEVQMNVDGVVPIMPTEFDGYEDEEDEKPQETTANVDRTTI